jgi:hypothetical protein
LKVNDLDDTAKYDELAAVVLVGVAADVLVVLLGGGCRR